MSELKKKLLLVLAALLLGSTVQAMEINQTQIKEIQSDTSLLFLSQPLNQKHKQVAGVYWLPDYVENNKGLGYGGRVNDGDAPSGETLKCSDYSLVSCTPPKIGSGKGSKPVPGSSLICYTSCKCATTSNCTSEYSLTKPSDNAVMASCQVIKPSSCAQFLTKYKIAACNDGYVLNSNDVQCDVRSCPSGFTAGLTKATCPNTTDTYTTDGKSGTQVCGKCTTSCDTSIYTKTDAICKSEHSGFNNWKADTSKMCGANSSACVCSPASGVCIGHDKTTATRGSCTYGYEIAGCNNGCEGMYKCKGCTAISDELNCPDGFTEVNNNCGGTYKKCCDLSDYPHATTSLARSICGNSLSYESKTCGGITKYKCRSCLDTIKSNYATATDATSFKASNGDTYLLNDISGLGDFTLYGNVLSPKDNTANKACASLTATYSLSGGNMTTNSILPTFMVKTKLNLNSATVINSQELHLYEDTNINVLNVNNPYIYLQNANRNYKIASIINKNGLLASDGGVYLNGGTLQINTVPDINLRINSNAKVIDSKGYTISGDNVLIKKLNNTANLPSTCRIGEDVTENNNETSCRGTITTNCPADSFAYKICDGGIAATDVATTDGKSDICKQCATSCKSLLDKSYGAGKYIIAENAAQLNSPGKIVVVNNTPVPTRGDYAGRVIYSSDKIIIDANELVDGSDFGDVCSPKKTFIVADYITINNKTMKIGSNIVANKDLTINGGSGSNIGFHGALNVAGSLIVGPGFNLFFNAADIVIEDDEDGESDIGYNYYPSTHYIKNFSSTASDTSLINLENMADVRIDSYQMNCGNIHADDFCIGEINLRLYHQSKLNNLYERYLTSNIQIEDGGVLERGMAFSINRGSQVNIRNGGTIGSLTVPNNNHLHIEFPGGPSNCIEHPRTVPIKEDICEQSSIGIHPYNCAICTK